MLHKLGLLFLGGLPLLLNTLTRETSPSTDIVENTYLPPSAPTPGSRYRLESVSNGKVLEIEDGLFNKGSKVQQYRAYDRNGIVDGYNQEWMFIPSGTVRGSIEYFIFNYGFLNFLDASASSVSAKDGAETAAQRWRLTPAGDMDTYYIQSVSTGKYLQAPSSTNDGETYSLAPLNRKKEQMFRLVEFSWGELGFTIGNVQLVSEANQGFAVSGNWGNGQVLKLGSECRECADKSFDIVPAGGHYVKLLHKEGTKTFAIDVAGWNAQSGERAVAWENTEVEKQKWLFVYVHRSGGPYDFDGRYIFFNKVSGRALEISNGVVNYSTPLRVNMFSNKPYQKWLYKKRN